MTRNWLLSRRAGAACRTARAHRNGIGGRGLLARSSGTGAVLAGLTVAVALLATPAHAQRGLNPLDYYSFDQMMVLAEDGNQQAEYRIGIAYETGQGVKVHLGKAAKWYARAAEQGHVDAAYRLGRLLHEGGRGLRVDPEKAVVYYNQAARAGHPDAQNWLGYAYQHGIGVEQNTELAVMWYRRSAKWGVAAAQNNLGLMFLTGKGVRRDYNLAAALFEQAVRQSYPWAQNNLAGMYEMGWGVKRDMDKARALYQAAAIRGNPNAQKNYARLMREARDHVIPRPKPVLTELADASDAGDGAPVGGNETADNEADAAGETGGKMRQAALQDAPAQGQEAGTPALVPSASGEADSLSALADPAKVDTSSPHAAQPSASRDGETAETDDAGGTEAVEASVAEAELDDEPGGLKVDTSETFNRD